MKNLDNIRDQNIKPLASEVYNLLESNFSVFKFEIEADEIYAQVDRNNVFFFSVEIRRNEAEFFLEEYNFVIYNEGSFVLYISNIILVINSIIKHAYKLVLHKLGNKTLKSDIVFNNSLEIELYKTLFFSFYQRVFSKKIRIEVKKV